MKNYLTRKIRTLLAALATAIFSFIYIPLVSAQEKPAADRSGYAPVNGLELYYEIHGSGEPLILLHGGLGAIDMFASMLPALAEDRRVIAVDLQGHGRTADIDRPIDVRLMADDIAGLMDFLDIQQADLAGYSMGGGVALQTAIRHPEKARRLVIISTPYKRDAFYPGILAQQAQMGPEAAEMMKQTPMYELYAHIAPRPEDWTRLIVKIAETMKVDYDWTEDIKKISVPVLIVAGDADIFPPSHAVEFFGLLGGGKRDGGWDGSGRVKSQLAILPGLTHYTIFQAPELLSVIKPFLETDMKKYNVEITRVFDAPIEQVWEAWQDPSLVKKWWGPKGFTCPVAEMDFREGGSSLVGMRSPQGQDMYNTWTYQSITPMKEIRYILNFTDNAGNKLNPADIGLPAAIPEDVPHEITLKDLGGKTEVRVTEMGYGAPEVAEMSKMGMEQCLDKMEAIFTGDFSSQK